MTQPVPEFTGKQVWGRLLEGNRRFVQGLFMGRNLLDLREGLWKGQKPVAAVLCCSDSRVPAEIIFDQSLGDLFVVRSAGLTLDPTTIGSLEYAVSHLHVPLLVIKGHQCCGAVTAAVNHPDLDEGHITSIVRQIAPAVDRARQTGKTGRDLVEAATDHFLLLLADMLRERSAVIAAALEQKRLDLVVSKYFLQTGGVEALALTF
jgi:carbonic anhydrase